ncbi:MAG: hypothetical protein mread185_000344 [Mycoplasmataceae bacterium]|nr:MAG: hypothetical protein mread185_000344 [Mycoplasmataceae bacterium]
MTKTRHFVNCFAFAPLLNIAVLGIFALMNLSWVVSNWKQAPSSPNGSNEGPSVRLNICGEIITQIMLFWQSISLDGFRPFWYLIGILLLTVFGMFLRGLLFSGVVGGSVSSTVSRLNVKTNKDTNKTKIRWKK